jgi:hypothetical protein
MSASQAGSSDLRLFPHIQPGDGSTDDHALDLAP